MGALAHYLEDEGLPTTQISLIREHTEKIKPPRALWVPFELGRPLGAPGDAAFQTRVLRRVLSLLEASSGPVLEDFSEEAPVAIESPTAVVCPVNFPAPVKDLTDIERLNETFQQEIHELRSWYDLTVSQRGRTTVGASRLTIDALGTFIGSFLDGTIPESPRPDIASLALLRLAVEDLKAYYFEALASQPGQKNATSTTLANWFWRETTAGQVMYTLQKCGLESDDKHWQTFSQNWLVPRAYRAESPYSRTET